MIIGYVLLGLIAVLMFFGLLTSTVRAMRIDPWVALFFVIAFIVGGIIPMINIGNVVTVGIGGFIVPFIFMLVLVVMVVMHNDVLRLVASIVSITAVTAAVLLWMPMEITWVAIMARFVIGLLAGAISYAICADRLSSVTGALGGIVWGNVVAAMVAYFMGNAEVIYLGGGVVFDAIVIGMVFAVVIAMVAKRMTEDGHAHKAASFEASEENKPDEWEKFDSYMDDEDK